MDDHLVRLMTDDGSIRASAARTTNLVARICKLQGTDPTASVALGRLTTAACLMGSLLKGSQRVALSIEGNGPVKKLQAEADAAGAVRATIRQPQSGLPPVNGKYDVANAIGKAGFLHVIKDLGLKDPYQGTVRLTTSEVAEDIAYYFAVSEQIPTSIALGVTLDNQAEVAASGGFLVQAMPGCSEEKLLQIETALQKMEPVSSQLRVGRTPLEILEQVLAGFQFALQRNYPLTFKCNCSKQYVVQMLHGLSLEELKELAQRQGDTIITCEYCKKKYHITAAEVAEVFLQAKAERKLKN